jgi:hypothetical protein
MNLHYQHSDTGNAKAPWVFTLEHTFNPKVISDKDILTHDIYQTISKRLGKQLFEMQSLLRESLQGGLSVQWFEMGLEHFDLEGRFDSAVCKLTLSNRGPSRFLLETHFFLDSTLVTLTRQEGILYFEELN